MNQHIPPGAWSEMQTVRECARVIGMKPGKAVNEYIQMGYSKAYVSGISEAARQHRMLQENSQEIPPCAS